MITGRLRADDGTTLAYERWPGGDGVHALLIHATGLCKETWRPVAEALQAAGLDVTATDQRGHGDSDLPPPPLSWDALGGDAATAAAVCGQPLIGVGHSSGGAALCMAEANAPGTFHALVLIEPVIFPPPYQRVADNSFSAGALRRRASFRSREEARRNYASSGPFARWKDDVLDAYVEHGFRDENGSWTLKCSPETEAEFYREGLNHDTWDRLPAIACPVVIVAGADSTTHGRDVVERLAERFPRATASIVPGATHFVPMERPDAVAAAVAEVVG